MNRKSLKLATACASLFAALWAGAAPAQPAYPDKPIRVIVPFPAGGSSDVSARMVLDHVARSIGQPIVVENRAGASGRIGAAAAAKAPADGYTLLLVNSASQTVPAALSVNPPPYDPVKDFSPISRLVDIPLTLMVNPKLPIHSLPELIAYARQHPGQLAIATPGVGTVTHLSGEILKAKTGIDIRFIHYRGDAPAVTDAIGGHVSGIIIGGGDSHHKSGALRAIGVTSRERSSRLPEVPTFAEAGVPGYEVVGWNGLAAPAGAPAAVIGTLHQAVAQALGDPALREQLAANGYQSAPSTPQQLAELIKSELTTWREIGETAGIRLE